MADILIVEDDKDLNNAYQMILERDGHKITAAYDGQQALDKLHHFQPDLILLDLLMPIKSGVEFLRAYGRPKKRGNTKIVIFTNFDKGPEISEAFKLGADKCVIKAWTAPQGLLKIVKEVLDDATPAASAAANV